MQDIEDRVFAGNDRSVTKSKAEPSFDFVYYNVYLYFLKNPYYAVYLQSHIMISNLSALKDNYLNMSFD
jgi:hypothetical protein